MDVDFRRRRAIFGVPIKRVFGVTVLFQRVVPVAGLNVEHCADRDVLEPNAALDFGESDVVIDCVVQVWVIGEHSITSSFGLLAQSQAYRTRETRLGTGIRETFERTRTLLEISNGGTVEFRRS